MMDYNSVKGLYLSKEFYIANILGKTPKDISPILESMWNDKYNSESYWSGLLEHRKKYLLSNAMPVKKGFKDLMSYLSAGGYCVGIVSSNSSYLIAKLLINAKIDMSIFDFIVAREDVVRVKPYPDLYELALKKSNIEKENVIAIEDSNVGIMSALNAGINTIYIQDLDIVSKEKKEKCIKIVKSLREVKYFLDEGRQEYGWKL